MSPFCISSLRIPSGFSDADLCFVGNVQVELVLEFSAAPVFRARRPASVQWCDFAKRRLVPDGGFRSSAAFDKFHFNASTPKP